MELVPRLLAVPRHVARESEVAVLSTLLKDMGLKDPGVLLKDLGALLKDPGVLLKDPGVLLKDPGVLLKDPGIL